MSINRKSVVKETGSGCNHWRVGYGITNAASLEIGVDVTVQCTEAATAESAIVLADAVAITNHSAMNADSAPTVTDHSAGLTGPVTL